MALDATVNECVATHQQATGHPYDPARTPSGSRPGPRWFVVSTYPQAERRALDHLQQQGYDAYLPLCTIRRRDRVLRTLFHPVEVPLFPSYAFVSFDPQHDPWRPIVNTLGVYALLRRPDGIPNPVAPGAVEALRAAQELFRTPTTPGSLWRPGAPCQPRDGPFQGLPAVVLEVERQIAKVAIVMFGQLRRVSVDVNSLVARE
jgi:transcriptional antiterminator RfaH